MNHTLLVSPVIRAFAEARDASNLDPDPTKQWRNFNPERKRVAIANTMSQWLSANTGNAFIEASVADFGRRALKPLDDADAAAAAAPQTGAEAAMAQWRASRVPSTPFFSNVKDAFERKAADQYANVMDREDLRAQLNHDYEEQKLHGAPPEGGFVSELVGGLAATLGGIGLASVAGSPVAGLAYAGAAEGIAARTMGTRNAYYAGLDRGDDEDTAWATAKNVGLRSGVIMGGVSAVPIAPAIGATQNIHNCSIAQPPTNTACPVERAGLTDVLVTGIEIRWISVNANPIEIGAKPTGARAAVAPRMIIRKNAVSTISATSPASSEYLPGECAP